MDNLPGYPDNIRLSRNGLLWVPLGEVRLEDDHWITTRGWFRDLIAKVRLYGVYAEEKHIGSVHL